MILRENRNCDEIFAKTKSKQIYLLVIEFNKMISKKITAKEKITILN